MTTTLTTQRTLWIQPPDLLQRLQSWEASTLIDARQSKDWDLTNVAIPDAVRMSPERFHIRPDWPRDQLTVVYGSGKADEEMVARLVDRLRRDGFDEAYGLRGGLKAWQAIEGVLELH